MKKFLAFVSVCFMTIMANAQKADIKVSYVEKYSNHLDFPLQKKFILHANKSISKFCDPVGEYVDSLRSTPKGEKEYVDMLTKAIESGGEPMSSSSDLWVFQSLEDEAVTVFDISGDDMYTYSESWNEMEWEIKDSVKTVLGYECIMAITNYHGREWIVWFAPELPLSYGPWKLRGLPGLILEAEDSQGKYRFEANGIVKDSSEIQPLYAKDKYFVAKRKEMLKSDRFILENPYAYLAAKTGLSLEELGYDGYTTAVASDWDFLETDYK